MNSSNDHSKSAQFPRESNAKGEFVRQESAFRRVVSADPTAEFPAVSGRYHLFVSLACPWAHRTIIVRKLKKLDDVISLSVVDPIRDELGWAFREGNGHGLDDLEGFRYLSEAYKKTDPDFDARVTVPVLWDKETKQIVNNESSEILRMLNTEFAALTEETVDLYPEALRTEIDEVNQRVYDTVNNGVYRCGFASSQEAYGEAFDRLFDSLEWLDARLEGKNWLVADTQTETDWRLFTTLIRFDAVYVGHFKCNKKRIADLPNVQSYLRHLYEQPGVAETVDFDHIKRHYYETHKQLNPSGIVPKGPDLPF
ncbi:MAG: glutathione S-transferase family protein [Planctomycetota bacterium]